MDPHNHSLFMILEIGVLCALVLIVVYMGVLYWNRHVRHWPLATFGIENVQKYLVFELDDYREAIWARGWMTSDEWVNILTRRRDALLKETEKKKRLHW